MMKKLLFILSFIILANTISATTFDESICFAISPLSTVNPEDLDLGKTKIKFCIDSECKNYTELGIRYSSDWGQHCMTRYEKKPPLHHRYRYYTFILVFKNGKTYETERINPEYFKNYYKLTIEGKKIAVKGIMPDMMSCCCGMCPTEPPKGLYYEINCEKTKECATEKTNKLSDGHEKDDVYHMNCNTLLTEEKCPTLYGDDRYIMADKLAILAKNLKTTPYEAGYKSKCKLSKFNAEDDACNAWSIAGHLEEDFPKNCFEKPYPAKKDKEIYNKLVYKMQSCYQNELAEKEREKMALREKEIKNPGETTYCWDYDDEELCKDYWENRGLWDD